MVQGVQVHWGTRSLSMGSTPRLAIYSHDVSCGAHGLEERFAVTAAAKNLSGALMVIGCTVLHCQSAHRRLLAGWRLAVVWCCCLSIAKPDQGCML